ncbi:hypothetical protein OQA88_1580 [Cercophora sp. LCS_1]
MGSTAPEQDEITVLVTGFAPFKPEYPINPSWEIARTLPSYLPPSSSSSLPPIRLLVHPAPIHVSYSTVRALVPQLWSRKIDYAIHIGMAGPRLFYSIERRGHRDGYAMKDVDGQFLNDQERRIKEGENWIWAGLPTELETDLVLDDVLVRWKGYCGADKDLRISEDAGRYLCDFIYYSSLAELYKRGRERNVVFFHVPCENSERNFEIGRGLLVELIRAVVESGEKAKGEKVKGVDGAKGVVKGTENIKPVEAVGVNGTA